MKLQIITLGFGSERQELLKEKLMKEVRKLKGEQAMPAHDLRRHLKIGKEIFLQIIKDKEVAKYTGRAANGTRFFTCKETMSKCKSELGWID